MSQLTVTLTQEPALTVAATRGTPLDLTLAEADTLDVRVVAPDGTEVALSSGEAFDATVASGQVSVIDLSIETAFVAEVLDARSVVSVFNGFVVASLPDTFETISRNLKSRPYTIQYDGQGRIDTITYDLGSGLAINKQFGYAPDGLSTITLSGDVPGGVTLTKSLSYLSGRLSSITYA